MQSSINLFGLSLRKNPRRGQIEAFRFVAEEPTRTNLTLKLPTGYGKTLTAAGIYAILKKQGRVNRCLYVTPRIGQREAIVGNGILDFADVGLKITQPVDVAFYDVQAIRRHRRNNDEIYTIVIHSLTAANGRSLVTELMQNGDWMIAIDEHHHVGNAKAWGKTIKHLKDLPGCRFMLAMSATPDRPDEDGAFGVPDYQVSYREAATEGDVKRLHAFSYVYRLDLIDEDNLVHTMTTDDLANLAGGNDPDKIEKMTVDRKMRWSPKYVSPLVSTPIERMLGSRTKSGGLPLQALITCMGVSHAKLVCEQVKSMYPDLRIDWVGTGMYGRSDQENREIIKKFCPPKKLTSGSGKMEWPTLDILVHVGMAGEGLDTTLVSEIVFLCPCNLTNTNLQTIGRGARRTRSS